LLLLQVMPSGPGPASVTYKPQLLQALEAGGLQFRTVAGPDGSFQFRAPGIPAGQVTPTFG
jgi:hypothetical protein